MTSNIALNKLIGIPYAGGNAGDFDLLLPYLSNDISLSAVEYAGHGRRGKELFYSSFQAMTEDVAKQINKMTAETDSYVILGYSMGAIAAYELVAQNLLEKKPAGIIFVSHGAPDVEWESKTYWKLTDEELLEKLKQMGGLQKCSESQLKNRFFRKLYYEPIRTGYRLLGQYHCSKTVQIPVPAIVVYSPNDITPEQIAGWKKFLKDKDKIVALGDHHFLIRDHAREIAEYVSVVLKGE